MSKSRRKPGNPNWVKGGPSPNPSGGRGSVRLDGMVNAYTGHGTSDDARVFTTHHTRPVSEQEAIDLRRGNWLAKRIVEWLPGACFQKGYTLKLDDKETAETVMTVLEEMGINQKLAAAGMTENTTGGAALYPVLDGAVGDVSEPLDLDDAPRILSVRAIHLLESRELSPVTWYDDINHPKFRRPSRYQVNALSSGGITRSTGVVIHESRLAVFPGVQVSIEQQPGQPWGWGDSKLTPVLDAIQDFGLAWGSAATILRNFSERVQAVQGLMKILSQKGAAAAVRENLKELDRVRSTLRTRIVDAEAAVTEQAKSVSGLSDLLIELAQVVCAAADMTMTRLFGRAAGGLNATGEGDEKIDHDKIATEQTHKYTSPAEWLIRLVLLSADGPTRGQEPDVWSIEWKPLKQQSEKETADTRKTVAETDQIYVDMGLPAVSVLRNRFAGDTFSMETTFDEAEFDEQQRVREEEAKALQAAELEAAKAQQAAADDDEDLDE